MSIHGPARYLGAPQNVYSPDHPVGFYQKIQIVSNLRRLLERNQIDLADCPRIVDLGCGGGFMLRMIAELRGHSEGLAGIDLAPDQLRAAHRQDSCISYIRSDIRRLPIADQSCALVTAFVSFMFLPTGEDISQAAGEAFRVLQTRGLLIVFDLVRGRDNRDGSRSFSASEIAVQVKRAGFRLLDRQSCFKNVFGLKRLCTAYLPARFPIPLVLLLERLPFSPANNVYLLFRKS